jgi:MFS family permease
VSSNHDSGRTTDRVHQRAADVVDDGSSSGRQPEADGRSHVVAPDRHTVVGREKDRFGGIKWGSAFFGWLTATGTGVILTALVAGAGTAVGVATDTTATDAANEDTSTVGIIGGIAILAILLVAYYCGGYVAGRMARFNGIKQGVAVWVWSLAIAVVVAVSSAVLGNEFDVLGRLNGFPRIPVDEGDLTTGGIIALAVAVIAALVGAVAGGLAGMRFHRKVDKAGLGR